MDPLDLITDPKIRGYIGDALIFTTFALPALEWLAGKTANKWDNQLVSSLRKLLSFVPRARLGNAPTHSRASAPTKPETPSAKADI